MRTNGPCEHCGREENGKWQTPCPSDDCPGNTLKSPEGFDIIGTLETVPGVALFHGGKIKDGKIVFTYAGDTEMDWNEQNTVLDAKGQRVFVDEKGFHWSENEVVEANKKGKKE